MPTPRISKSQFKARALEYFRQIETEGEPIVITDHGDATIEVRRYVPPNRDPLTILRGTASAYVRPTEPIDDDAWEAAR